MMKAYVINLDKDADRLAFMEQQLNALGIVYERIAAASANDITPEIAKAVRSPRKDGIAMNWKDSEIGCFLSHREAWRRVAVGLGDYGLIFEDDIHMADDLADFVKDESWIPAGAQIIRLESSTNRLLMGKARDTYHERKIARLNSTSWCAGAYIISKQAAQMLIDRPIDSMIDKADSYLFYHERSATARELKTWQVYPALCVQDKYLEAEKSGFDSNIEHVGDAYVGKGNLFHKIRHNLLSSVVKTARGYKRVAYKA